MNPLLQEAKGDQYAVLMVIHGYLEEGLDWPVWQYVERRVGPRGAALQALTSMPFLRNRGQLIGWKYGWTWWENFGASGGPNQNTKVQLTVAGLWALRFDELPRLYVELLRLCNDRWAQLPLSPTEVQYATISSHEVRLVLFPKQPSGSVTDKRLAQLKLLAQVEKPTFMQVATLPDGSWQLTVRDDIVEWANIDTVEAYLDRVMQIIEPEVNQVAAPRQLGTPAPTRRHRPAWMSQALDLAAREDHRGYFVGAWAALGTVLAGVATTLLVRDSAIATVAAGTFVAALSITFFGLMFAALFHLPPHRPRTVAQARPAEAIATAYSATVTVTAPHSARVTPLIDRCRSRRTTCVTLRARGEKT